MSSNSQYRKVTFWVPGPHARICNTGPTCNFLWWNSCKVQFCTYPECFSALCNHERSYRNPPSCSYLLSVSLAQQQIAKKRQSPPTWHRKGQKICRNFWLFTAVGKNSTNILDQKMEGLSIQKYGAENGLGAASEERGLPLMWFSHNFVFLRFGFFLSSSSPWANGHLSPFTHLPWKLVLHDLPPWRTDTFWSCIGRAWSCACACSGSSCCA